MPVNKRVRWTQDLLNEFFDSRDLTYKKLTLDGELGPNTKRNIRHARYYLGLGKTIEAQSSQITDELIRTLKDPRRRLSGWSAPATPAVWRRPVCASGAGRPTSRRARSAPRG